MKRFELLDFLKGYAIFTIMIYHYLKYLSLGEPLNTMISFGGTGVHLYVLISGFGLYYSYLKNPITYNVFLRKRFVKVYVPYVLVILLSAFISLFVTVYDNSLYALGGHIFLYKMFDEKIMGSYGYPLWFISMIIQFYLVFYLIVWIKSKLNEIPFLVMGILLSLGWAVLVLWMGKDVQRVWNSFFLQYIWEFALGMILAERVLNEKRIIGDQLRQSMLFLIAVINCAIFALLAIKGGPSGRLLNDFFALTGYSLLAVWIYNLNIKPLNQVFLYIGKISFSVYLLHTLVLLTIVGLFVEMNSVFHVLIALTLIIPLAALYQRGIDGFFRQMGI